MCQEILARVKGICQGKSKIWQVDGFQITCTWHINHAHYHGWQVRVKCFLVTNQ